MEGPLKILVPQSHSQSLPTHFQPPGCRAWESTLNRHPGVFSCHDSLGTTALETCNDHLQKNIGLNEEALAERKCPLRKCLCPGESGWGGSFEACLVHHFLNCLLIMEQLESCQIFLFAQAFHVLAHTQPPRVLSKAPD